MQLKKNYATLGAGEQLLITATDQAFGKDVASWCKMTGAELVSLENKNGVVAATIRKQEKQEVCNLPGKAADNKTLIVFSDDLDKALASFVIANGAASTGRKVTMFFTFWGLDIIKKHRKPAVSKDLFGKMFGWMLPAHSGKLKLSKMNMGGAGTDAPHHEKEADRQLGKPHTTSRRQWHRNDCLHHEHGRYGHTERGTAGQRHAGRCSFLPRTGGGSECEPVHLTNIGSYLTEATLISISTAGILSTETFSRIVPLFVPGCKITWHFP